MEHRGAGALCGHEVTAITGKAGYQPKLSRQACYGRTLVEGRFDCLEYADGLSVHLSDLTELADVTSQATLSPQVSFIVLLAGELCFTLDDLPVRLTSTSFDVSCGAMILESTTLLRRQVRAGAQVSKVHVTVTPGWLKKHCGDMTLDVWSQSLNRQQIVPTWSASRDMASAAKAILAPSERPAYLQKLFVQNQAAIIVSEGLCALHRLNCQNGSESRRVHQVAAVQEYLDNHLAEPLDLATIGRRFGMSVSTLQRYFKHSVGVTVASYIRYKRLEQARQQLQRKKVTVSQAAYMAGYSHPNNFIAAYKKRFGCCPGEERISSTR